MLTNTITVDSNVVFEKVSEDAQSGTIYRQKDTLVPAEIVVKHTVPPFNSKAAKRHLIQMHVPLVRTSGGAISDVSAQRVTLNMTYTSPNVPGYVPSIGVLESFLSAILGVGLASDLAVEPLTEFLSESFSSGNGLLVKAFQGHS